MVVDRDAMPTSQRAAWDRLWRILLRPGRNEPHAGDSLAASTDAGETADSKKLTTSGNDATGRSRNDA